MNYPAPGAGVSSRSLPDITDAATAPFWEASKRHVLVAQRCEDCRDTRFPHLDLCPKCWSQDQGWVEIAPTGELWSFVVYHRALDPTKKDEIPYVIGRVVTDDGPIFNVRLDVPPDEAKVGMRLTATWDDVTDDVTLLRFGPVKG
jgi:uncharacterized OB-fold protein